MKKKDIIFVMFLVVFYLIRSYFYNTIIYRTKAPDIDYHRKVVELYKGNPITIFFWNRFDINILCEERDLYNPPVSTSPFLYHSVIGKIWYLVEKIKIGDSYKIVTFLQSLLGLGTILYIYALGQLIDKKGLTKYFSSLFVLFIPMFGYTSAFLTYDNFVVLFSTMSIYYYVKFLIDNNINNVLLMIIVCFLGLLSKISFMPLCLILFLLIFVNVFTLNGRQLKYLSKSNKFLLFLVIFLFLFVLFFFGRNLYLFKSISPGYSLGFEGDCYAEKFR